MVSTAAAPGDQSHSAPAAEPCRILNEREVVLVAGGPEGTVTTGAE